MLKKIFYWISIILQVLFVIAAYVIQYFSMKRMGMMRYVVFKNHEWEAQYPITALKYAAIIFLIILCVAAILYVKTKKGNYIKDKKALPMLLAGIVLTLIFVLFTLIFSTGNYRSYYFTSLILAIITLIQHIKILLI
ncbi:hypothetical protein JK636_00745 [Clostridium sp. YIM B02515]|uniref:Uncharacterized protein n=1 Tax=Clostridium rhizosphaerae TaxID=2803861 RepID=A0ABS1T4M6_9CLOT|nr:hypothetical protein [Clostridium rhizosphaerae]MBL4934278.1 hypothetical protein [Clostridium rhizosphaerae]